jgi:hypothetical protein
VRFDHARRLPVYSWGSGPTILLAHGWSGRGSQLGAFVEPLVEQGFRLVREWPGAKLMTTIGLGHSRILRAPAVVAAAVDFLCPASASARPGTALVA